VTSRSSSASTPASEAGTANSVNTSPVVVRLADGNDLDGVVAVGRTAWKTTYASLYSPELLELFLAKWWTKDANVPAIRARRTFVAEQNGRIIAMAAYGTHRSKLTIWKIYVLAEAQGQGIGGRLLDAIYEQASPGHDSAYLSFTDGNASAYDFAISHGYVVDHREEQSGMPDLVWMRYDFDTVAAEDTDESDGSSGSDNASTTGLDGGAA